MEYRKEVAVLEQRISEFNALDTGSSHADNCRDAGVWRKSDIKREWQYKKHDQELSVRIAI